MSALIMTTDEKVQALAARCKGGVTITLNEHKLVYQSVTDYIKDEFGLGGECGPEVTPEMAAKMIATDTIVEIQFYPMTPIGFYRVADVVLADALDRAITILNCATDD